MWFLLKGNLSTSGFLAYRKIISYDDAFCFFFCDIKIETIVHLFIYCYVTRSNWNRFIQWIGYDEYMPKTIQLLLQEWNHLLYKKFQRKAIYMFYCGILCSICITRNKFVFDVIDLDWNKVYNLTFYYLV
jgi:hypothetical protein